MQALSQHLVLTLLGITMSSQSLSPDARRLPAILRNHAVGEKHLIETMTGGMAVLDFDADGWDDLFFTNGAPQPLLRKESKADCNQLFRNISNGSFVDVTEKSGLCGTGYDMSAATGDFDNDGYPDLFVGGVRESALWRNRGDGTFEKRLVSIEGWVVGGGWFDYDRDGDLDLFVVRYVAWDPANESFCGDTVLKVRAYCHPQEYQGLANVLLRNDSGRFIDVSKPSGIARHVGKGMAAAFGDIDGDSWLDVFVTNDTEPSFLFRNRGDGTFEEIAEQAGVARNDDGRALSGMGADFRDIDNDGRDDLFFTALANETFPLYLNLGRALFRDVTYPSRIGRATLPYSGWGCGVYDFDLDGRKDIFAANGDVQTNTERFSSRASKQANLMLLARDGGTFEASSLGSPAWHRGVGFGDFNNDGRVDVAVTRLGESPVVFRGSAEKRRHWLVLRLRSHAGNRDGIGALVRLQTPDGRVQWNRVTTAVGYASSSSPAVFFGLGEQTRASVEIIWTSGKRQKLTDVAADQRLTVDEP